MLNDPGLDSEQYEHELLRCTQQDKAAFGIQQNPAPLPQLTTKNSQFKTALKAVSIRFNHLSSNTPSQRFHIVVHGFGKSLEAHH